MPALDADVRIQILTFKEGLLSRVAHDLRFDVTAFTVEQDGDVIEARIDATSLRVDTAMKRGQPSSRPSESDRRKIEQNVRDEVLDAARHPEIVFRSEAPRTASVAGTLSLHGRDRPVRLQFRDLVNERVAEVRLDQRDYGITPYSAMGGTLKVKAEVIVRITTTWGARDGDRRTPVSAKA
jgi:polyisoprenoid-binding protein YceI